MPESTPTQDMRDILRTFRVAVPRRIEQEKHAGAIAEAEHQAARAEVASVEQEATGQLGRLQKSGSSARTRIQSAGVDLPTEHASVPTPLRLDVEPRAGLNQAVAAAASFGQQVEGSIAELGRRRDARRARRERLMMAAGVAGLVVLGLLAFFLYTKQTEDKYQAAVTEMQSGEWDKARDNLESVVSRKQDYKDASARLRETRYQLGVGKLQKQLWLPARTDLQQVANEDQNYKDVRALIRETYYQTGVAAVRAQQWDRARPDLQRVVTEDASYKDAAALLGQVAAAQPSPPGLGQTVTLNGVNSTVALRSGNSCGGVAFQLTLANTQSSAAQVQFEVTGNDVWYGSPPSDGCYSGRGNRASATVRGGQTIEQGFRVLGSGTISIKVTIGDASAAWVVLGNLSGNPGDQLNLGAAASLSGINTTTKLRPGNSCEGVTFQVTMANTQSNDLPAQFEVAGNTVWYGSPPRDGCYSDSGSRAVVTVPSGRTVEYGFRVLGSGAVSITVTVGNASATWKVR